MEGQVFRDFEQVIGEETRSMRDNKETPEVHEVLNTGKVRVYYDEKIGRPVHVYSKSPPESSRNDVDHGQALERKQSIKFGGPPLTTQKGIYHPLVERYNRKMSTGKLEQNDQYSNDGYLSDRSSTSFSDINSYYSDQSSLYGDKGKLDTKKHYLRERIIYVNDSDDSKSQRQSHKHRRVHVPTTYQQRSHSVDGYGKRVDTNGRRLADERFYREEQFTQFPVRSDSNTSYESKDTKEQRKQTLGRRGTGDKHYADSDSNISSHAFDDTHRRSTSRRYDRCERNDMRLHSNTATYKTDHGIEASHPTRHDNPISKTVYNSYQSDSRSIQTPKRHDKRDTSYDTNYEVHTNRSEVTAYQRHQGSFDHQGSDTNGTTSSGYSSQAYEHQRRNGYNSDESRSSRDYDNNTRDRYRSYQRRSQRGETDRRSRSVHDDNRAPMEDYHIAKHGQLGSFGERPSRSASSSSIYQQNDHRRHKIHSDFTPTQRIRAIAPKSGQTDLSRYDSVVVQDPTSHNTKHKQSYGETTKVTVRDYANADTTMTPEMKDQIGQIAPDMKYHESQYCRNTATDKQGKLSETSNNDASINETESNNNTLTFDGDLHLESEPIDLYTGYYKAKAKSDRDRDKTKTKVSLDKTTSSSLEQTPLTESNPPQCSKHSSSDIAINSNHRELKTQLVNGQYLREGDKRATNNKEIKHIVNDANHKLEKMNNHTRKAYNQNITSTYSKNVPYFNQKSASDTEAHYREHADDMSSDSDSGGFSSDYGGKRGSNTSIDKQMRLRGFMGDGPPVNNQARWKRWHDSGKKGDTSVHIPTVTLSEQKH
ncbi:unnamed protein product, partial [Owenia fusiformis]